MSSRLLVRSSPLLRSALSTLSTVFSIGAITTALLLSQSSAHAQSCGSTTRADIVILLDVTASSSAADIAEQKVAARALVERFSSSSVRPQISVGTVNSPACQRLINGRLVWVPCDPSTIPGAARIITPLSNNYTAALFQLGSGTGIVGDSYEVSGNGLGGTNMNAAVTAARNELTSTRAQSGVAKIAIIISDGDPTFPAPAPGFEDNAACNNQSCATAENAGATAATSARSAGIRIITIHKGDTQFGGPAYLRDRISGAPGDFYQSLANMNGVFTQISQQLVCNDGRACTTDFCGSNGSCSFVENDSDGDGVGDCSDLCSGNNSLVGQPCDGGDADLCNGGVYSCGNGVLTCSDGAALDDANNNGIPDCQENGSTALCTTADTLGFKQAMSGNRLSQSAQVTRLLRDLEIRRRNCPSPATITRFLASSRTTATTSANGLQLQTEAYPNSLLSCPASSGCSSISVAFAVDTFGTRSNSLRTVARRAAQYILQCKSGSSGRCEGSASECKRRSEIRRRAYRQELALADSLHAQQLATSKALPLVTASCRVP